MESLNGETAIVTGSCRGIGREIALQLAAMGVNIVINYVHESSFASAERVRKEICNIGSDAIAVRADVSKMKSVKRLVNEALRKFGHIDIVVNNAAIFRRRPFIKTKDADYSEWRKMLDVNLIGPFLVIMTVLNSDNYRRKRLKVVNMASVAAISGGSVMGCPYAASKAGIISMTQFLAKAYGNQMRVNSVSPGLTNTRILKLYRNKEIRRHIEETPLHRIMQPVEIAEAVAFLVAHGAVNGHNLIVDGGRLRR